MDILTDSRQVRRLDVVDTGRRRRWSDAEKLRIVEESFSGPRLVSAIAAANQSGFESTSVRASSPTPARTRETFLDDPQLLGIRPAPSPTSIYNVKATHLTTISKDIHTDSQLQTGKNRKAAVLGRVPR